jgi:hypothetical protein
MARNLQFDGGPVYGGNGGWYRQPMGGPAGGMVQGPDYATVDNWGARPIGSATGGPYYAPPSMPQPVTSTPTTTIDPTTGLPVATSATSGFDISTLLSGTIFGLPSWIVLGAAAYFLFFRKGR